MRLSLARKIIVEGIKKNVSQTSTKPITFHLDGSMGIGKTALAKWIANDINFYLVIVSLPQMEPTDVGGLRMPNGSKMTVLQPD